MTRKTRPYREALLEALADPQEAALYLSVARLDSPEMFRKACLNVIQARRQVAQVAREVGVSRESLYRSLSAEGNPSQETVDSVLEALNFEYVGIRSRDAETPRGMPPSSVPLGIRSGRRNRRSRTVSKRQLKFNYESVPVPQVSRNVSVVIGNESFFNAATNVSITIRPNRATVQVQGSIVGTAHVPSPNTEMATVPAFICVQQNQASSKPALSHQGE
jgi:probable addiction module antidote protein